MVVDTSVLLAVLFYDPGTEWAIARLEEHAAALRMSTVNLTETLIRLRDRQPQLADELENEILDSGIRFVPPDAEQCRLAAAARARFPLNLGDCFAYALAVTENVPMLSLDSGFRRFDHPVLLPG
jgi:ribonuclease VapC